MPYFFALILLKENPIIRKNTINVEKLCSKAELASNRILAALLSIYSAISRAENSNPTKEIFIPKVVILFIGCFKLLIEKTERNLLKSKESFIICLLNIL